MLGMGKGYIVGKVLDEVEGRLVGGVDDKGEACLI